MCHLTATGAEAGRTHVHLDLIFHERKGGSKGHMGCRGPSFGDTDVCLHLQQLASVEYGQDGSGPKFGVFLPAWPLCWCYPPCPPFPCDWLLAVRLL